jgi:hypothetical protein
LEAKKKGREKEIRSVKALNSERARTGWTLFKNTVEKHA